MSPMAARTSSLLALPGQATTAVVGTIKMSSSNARIASTGTALSSGVEAAAAVLADHHGTTDLPAGIKRYRLTSMPRA